MTYQYKVNGVDDNTYSDTAPTGAGDYTVKATVAATSTHKAAEATADFTITKADATPATVTANNRTYDGTEKPLVTVNDSTLVGGTMQYALGTADSATGDYSASIPTATAAGTYYVWYKVVGDGNHNDTAPVCVEVRISNPPSSSNHSSSSASSAPTNNNTVTVPVSSDKGSTAVSATVSGEVAAVAPMTARQIDAIVGDTEDSAAVMIDLSGLPGEVTAATIPAATLQAIESAVNDPEKDADSLTVNLTEGSVTFDAAALSAISEQMQGSDLRLNLANVGENRLRNAQKAAIESMDVQKIMDAYITSDGTRISDFEGGTAEITVPYDLKDAQQPGGIVVYYVATDGTTTEVPAVFDPISGELSFTVGHFSNYVIAYDSARTVEQPPEAEEVEEVEKVEEVKDTDCPILAFTDADPNAWYHDGVHFALDNGIMSGMGDGIFAPNGTTSRAMIAQILWNMEGRPVVNYAMSYTDVDADAWYAEAVRWASAERIMSGYDAAVFGPEDSVTREQLAAIMHRYAQRNSIDVTLGEETNILSYDDVFEVSDWAVPAIQWTCGSGLMTGRTASTLNPKDTATRAEIATIMMRYCTSIAI